MRVSLLIVPSHPHERSTVDSLFFIFNLINLEGHVADQWTLRRSTKWGLWLCRQNNLFYRSWAQAARQLRTLRDLYSDLPEWIRRHRHGTVVLVRCGTRRWAYQKSAIFTNCSLRSEKNLRTWWRKFVTSSVLFHTNKYGETRVRTKFKFVSKTEIKSRPGKRANQDSPWKTKKCKFLLKSDLRSRSTELQADSNRRSIQELTGINFDSQRMEIDHTITGCEQSRRDQLLPQEEMSEQNRALRETCIRNMRDMEELQEKSRVKGRGTIKKKIDWRLWGSNFILPGLECPDSLEPWRQRREAPRWWDWRRAHQEFAGLTTVPPGARSKCEPVAGLSLTKRRFVSRRTVNFSKYGETRKLDVTKRKSNLELDNCQTRIIFGKTREQVLAEAKSEILRHEYRADLAEYNTCELKRQIESQEVEIGHTRTGFEQSRREQALLHEELADRERALRHTRIRSIQKLEELKRDQECRLEFSRRRMVENYFKDVELVRGGQLFHVPSQPALFPLPREPGGLLSRD